MDSSLINTQQPKTQKLGLTSGKPICCCCPDTKLLRDECVVHKGEEHADCLALIEAHKQCLRAEGFSVN
jgi:cytochrome c oxidase assembly protein subunit 17